jgi:hypothetical protein
MQIDNALKAFSFSSGILASDLSLLIRTILLAAFLMWASWCVLALLKYYKTHAHSAIANLLKDYVQLFILISIVISLIFIK